MKLITRQRKLGSKLSGVHVDVALTQPTELLAFIVGRQIMYGICPKDSLTLLVKDPAEQSSLLNLWHKSGLIAGSPFNWQPIIPLSAQKPVTSLPTMPEFRAESHHSEAKTLPTIADLVRAYKTALRTLKARGEPFMKQRNIVNFFRTACRQHDPNRVMAAIPAFIAHQSGSKSARNYSVEQMAIYLRHTIPRKK
jgi:hypothetical protein